ncbi:MAG: hypothetical protein IT433_00340 [Phycisphaerales bacterium]|nr:hypothetical protein [Phycisphaerales bacterium]
MNCKACEYPLWNLTSRTCPECGAPFKPSDFEFALNAVRFCCPHCAQEYYGTGARGHLVPSYFNCVSCGKPVHMDECVLLPTAGVREELTRADENPWLARARLGRAKAWFSSIGRAMTQPGRLIEATPTGSGWGFGFAILTNLIFNLVGWAGFIIFVVIISTVAAGGKGGGARPLLGISGGIGAGAASVVLFLGVGILAWIAVTHWLLRITGGSAHPISRTAQAICYSSGANVLSAVPCLSLYIWPLALIWWAVSATIMVARGQKVHGGRAAFAVLAPPGVVVLAAAAGFAWFMYWSINMANTMNAAPPPVPPAPTAIVSEDGADPDEVEAVLGRHREEAGHWPFHAIELVGGGLRPEQLTGDAPDEASSGRLYGADLGVYYLGTEEQKTLFHDLVRSKLPERIIAHRLGRFVFTYHGVDPQMHPDLWVMVRVRRQGSEEPIAVTRAGGVTDWYSNPEDFAEALKTQNAAREAAGLAALPDLMGIEADTPAVGP